MLKMLVVPTAPAGDATNRIASTQFVSRAVGSAAATAGTVSSVTAGTGLAGGTITTTGTISLGTGNVVMVATFSANNATAITFSGSITTTYRDYVLVIDNLIAATSGTIPRMMLDAGGIQSSNYSCVAADIGSNNATGSDSVTSFLYITTARNTTLGTTGPGASGAFVLYNPSNTTMGKIVQGRANWNGTDAVFRSVVNGGTWNSSTAVTGLQITMATGNISSGTATLYGII